MRQINVTLNIYIYSLSWRHLFRGKGERNVFIHILLPVFLLLVSVICYLSEMGEIFRWPF